jgi:hypothetical protein
MRQVFAYLDAGTGSMLLQIVVGGVAAIGVGGRLMWRRMTGKLPKVEDEVPAEPEAPTPAE